MLPFPRVRHRVVTTWTHLMLAWLRLTCGLHYRVRRLENIPTPLGDCLPAPVRLGNHGPATDFSASGVGGQKELMWIPFFGWGWRRSAPS